MHCKQECTRISAIFRSSKGFSLVELAVVLLVVGFVLGGATSMIVPYIESSRYETTQKKLEKIADALAVYAQEYYSLPCPALPNPSTEDFGTPPGTAVRQSCNVLPARVRGIVPFRVLGLSEDDVKDAYGNYITYAVSPVFDYDKANLGVYDTNFRVHRNCLTPEWTEGNKFWNMRKAKFCCPISGATPLTVWDSYTGGNEVFVTEFGNCPSVEGNWTGGVPSVPASCVTRPRSSETIAFVLVSHGRAGNGAYLRGGGIRDFIGVPTNVQEKGNSADTTQGDMRFVSRPISLEKTNNYFDDIILWRTNHQLVNAFGNDSCDKP